MRQRFTSSERTGLLLLAAVLLLSLTIIAIRHYGRDAQPVPQEVIATEEFAPAPAVADSLLDASADIRTVRTKRRTKAKSDSAINSKRAAEKMPRTLRQRNYLQERIDQ